MNFLQKIGVVWQGVSLVQRALLIAIVLTLIIAGGLLVYWAHRPDMRMLYQELAPEEASKVVDKIAEKGIAYELRSGGTSIYVPKENVYQLRLDMAKEGLPASEQGGYRIFDNEKIGISPFVQNVNLKRALEEELAKSIQIIEGVAHARVHIVSTEQKLFTSQASGTSASVVLQIKAGFRLSASNIAAITHLVAGSVEGLKVENVTVVDSQGRLLSGRADQTMAGGAGTVHDYRERVEQSLAKKAEDMLTAVLGSGRATVKVSAVVDMNSVDTVTETYQPRGTASKEEIKSESEIGASSATAEGNQTIPGSTRKDETITTEYSIGKTVTREVALPGEIKSLMVAAIVDLLPADVNEAEASQASKIMQISDVEKLIENALGLNLEGADSLKVVEARFYRATKSPIEQEQSSWPRYIAIARHASLGIMAVCALLVFRIFISGAKKKTIPGPEAAQLSQGVAATGFLPAGAQGSEPLALRRQIADTLQSDPERVRQLFASWLEEKGNQ